MFAEQITSLPVLVLDVLELVSLAVGGLAEAVVILGAVVANGIIAIVTEQSAERIILALDDTGAVPLPRSRTGTTGFDLLVQRGS